MYYGLGISIFDKMQYGIDPAAKQENMSLLPIKSGIFINIYSLSDINLSQSKTGALMRVDYFSRNFEWRGEKTRDGNLAES